MTPWPKPPNREKADGEERASLEALVEMVIGAAYEVSNVLGAGFVEKVYERALLAELKLRDLPTSTQAPFSVGKGKHVFTNLGSVLGKWAFSSIENPD